MRLNYFKELLEANIENIKTENKEVYGIKGGEN